MFAHAASSTAEVMDIEAASGMDRWGRDAGWTGRFREVLDKLGLYHQGGSYYLASHELGNGLWLIHDNGGEYNVELINVESRGSVTHSSRATGPLTAATVAHRVWQLVKGETPDLTSGSEIDEAAESFVLAFGVRPC